jgi:hypothetical protein
MGYVQIAAPQSSFDKPDFLGHTQTHADTHRMDIFSNFF